MRVYSIGGSRLSAGFWAEEEVATANHIRNRCPSKSIKGQVPFKIWEGKSPYVGYFRTFGTTVFMLDKGPGKGKFDSRSKICILVGYSEV